MSQSSSRAHRKRQHKRNANTLLSLAPKKTPGHDEPLPALNRETLVAALSDVAAHIVKQKRNVTIIAVGGAVNTIHLQSRISTHDVDFFNDNLTAKDLESLINGAKAAAKRDKRLTEQWLNNRTIFFIPKNQRAALTAAALQQREVIFLAPGLTVLAAPWDYAFCCKVDRLAGAGIRPAAVYDRDDAVEYLSRYLSKHGMAQVQKKTVQMWFAQYSLRWTSANDTVVAEVNAAYRTRFSTNHDAIF
jgi:hypothetical protein